jgi:hypothetical protein
VFMAVFMRGLLAGGTSAYLHRKAGENVQEGSREAWATIAVQANHLFYLAVIILREARIENDFFYFCSKNTLLLTPVVLASFYDRQNLTAVEKSIASGMTSLYYLASFVSSLALLGLGKREFALGSLTMLGLDLLSRGEMLPGFLRALHGGATKVASLLSLLGYGTWILTSEKISWLEKCIFSLGAGGILAPKIADFFKRPPPDNSHSGGGSMPSLSSASLSSNSCGYGTTMYTTPYSSPSYGYSSYGRSSGGYSSPSSQSSSGSSGSSWSVTSAFRSFSEPPPNA